MGDLKKEDAELTTESGRRNLWKQKRKYVEGLTRYVLFLTAHYLWLVLPTGETVAGFEDPCNLSKITFEELREKLQFLSYEQATHRNQWATFIDGQLPYVYLKLDEPETLDRLRQDLQTSFAELNVAAEGAIATLIQQYTEFKSQEQEIQRNLVDTGDTQRRAFVKLRFKFDFHRHLFEDLLPRFEDQYGRDVNAKGKQVEERIRESFVADSVAVLVARVLFLRLIEDLGLTKNKKRRLSNGGPQAWAAFVDHLTDDAKALVELVAKDVGRLYHEPFERNLFDWIYQTNGALDEALQRLILRFNAYDFAGLSEEILGDIYQTFLPTAKQKRLGEFYTPASIVDWLLEQTVFSHGEGKLLDPSCGSGSFLVRYMHRCLEDAKTRGLDPDAVLQELQATVWGFDLNPFAAFISHFQLMWALVRFKPSTNPADIPKIHIYPRNLDNLPWIRNLDSRIEQRLVDGYNELARLAARAKNNPNEWLLSEVETQIVTSRYKLSDRNLGLNFSNWSPEDVQVAELSLDENSIRAGLFSLELVDADVAELVYKLLTLNADEETTISRGIIQKLLVPQDYAALMQAYRQRFDSFQQVESDFFAALAQIDQTVYEMFELTNAEKAHIETRLTSFPLNKLQPRYPWQTVKPRPIKAYTSDRFA